MFVHLKLMIVQLVITNYIKQNIFHIFYKVIFCIYSKLLKILYYKSIDSYSVMCYVLYRKCKYIEFLGGDIYYTKHFIIIRV